MAEDKGKIVTVDLMDFSHGPHWLSPAGRHPEMMQRIRDKHRAIYKAQRAMNRLQARLDKQEKKP